MHDFVAFGHNHIFWVAASAWLIAQTLKVLIGVCRERRFNFRWFVGSGGMPSSHAASVSALATVVGLSHGLDSALFAVTVAFALIVCFDAQGVRHSSGKQAVILNKMLDDIYWQKQFDETKLKEFLGHTPVQVIAGVALGIAVGLFLY